MDDILIHTKCCEGETEGEHLEQHHRYVHTILAKLEKNNLYLKLEKCAFEVPETDYLGVIVGNNSVRMDPKKLKGVADFPQPMMLTEVPRFLGFIGYYQYFIPYYSKIAWPLLDLTKKTTLWHWEEPQIKAFEELKTCMCEVPVLAQPDFTKHFYLQCNTSAYGVGAILLQEGEHTTPTLT
jgi:hypothetical protein